LQKLLYKPKEEEKNMSITENKVSKLNIAGELLRFFWHNKRWWITPMIVGLLIIGVVVIFAQSSAIAPFIYTLF
jgi:uncharacterized membrane protein